MEGDYEKRRRVGLRGVLLRVGIGEGQRRGRKGKGEERPAFFLKPL